jgi:hypothetical protein
MANRTTVKSDIVGLNIPSVSNATMTTMLNNKIADNVKFREDVAVVQNSVVSNITCDFTGKDRIDLTRTGGSLSIFVSGIGDGESVFLKITKSADQQISFLNAMDITPNIELAYSPTNILYEILRKGSQYFAKAWYNTVVGASSTQGLIAIATVAENNALANSYKACVPGRLPLSTGSQKGLVRLAADDAEGKSDTRAIAATPRDVNQAIYNIKNTNDAWINLAVGSGFARANVLQYFKDNAGNVHVRCKGLQVYYSYPDLPIVLLEVGLLPVGYRPKDCMVKFFVQSVKSDPEDSWPPNLANTLFGQVNIDGEIYIINRPISAFGAIMAIDMVQSFYVIFRAEQ